MSAPPSTCHDALLTQISHQVDKMHRGLLVFDVNGTSWLNSSCWFFSVKPLCNGVVVVSLGSILYGLVFRSEGSASAAPPAMKP